ncbi:MAG: hypothetical protein GY713_19185, partial [Actinomycetia bacterium]|nr:hypothetical protein [Actinomycetes bacterium]
GASYLFLNDTTTGSTSPFAFHHDNLQIDVGAGATDAGFADIDRDGDLDLAINVDGGANQLWQSGFNDGGNNDYLVVRALRCLSGGGYRDDVGAIVRLWDASGSVPISPLRQVSGGRGHGSEDAADVHFGLPQGPDSELLVTVGFTGNQGEPGPVVTTSVVPSELGGYQLIELRRCDAPNQPPVAHDQSVATERDQPLPITLEGSDPEGQALSFSVTSGPDHGALAGTAPDLTYTPDGGYVGADSFSFVADDGELLSSAATVSIEVLAPSYTEAAAAAGLATPGIKTGGLAWCDFNHDGLPDVLVNTGTSNDAGRSYLYFNRGDGSFSDVTETHAGGLISHRGQRSAICADINNDGWLDLARNDWNRVEVYLNRGPTATPSWSFGDAEHNPSQVWTSIDGGMNTEGMGWLDADLDGDLDLILDNHDYGIDLFANDGSGTLTHITPDAAGRGLPQSATTGDYAAVADYNNDGWVDVIDRKEDQLDLWTNTGDAQFTGNASFDDQARDGNKGGAAFCDLDADGDFDLVWTDAGTNQIWRNDGGSLVPTGEPAASSGTDLGGQDLDGVTCADLDNDGDLDLFLAAASGPSYLFDNQTAAGGALAFRRDHRLLDLDADGEGVAVADYDLDGDLDLLVNIDDGANQLWVNHHTDGLNEDYLVVRALRCLGGGYYRDDVGARIRLLDLDGVTPLSPLREVNGGRGHGSQDLPFVHFGLPLGADRSYLVEVTFQGEGGIPGAAVTAEVHPAAIDGYNLLAIKQCAEADQPPIAYDQTVSFEPDTPVDLELQAFDPEGHALGYTLVSVPLHGALSGEPPLLTYIPDSGFTGTDSLTFTAGDGAMTSVEATVTLQGPPPGFTEIGSEIGLAHPGSTEGGLVWCDIDDDGDLDLLINTELNSSSGRSRLLVNDAGSFTDVTTTHAAGLARNLGRRSALCADLNNDGYPDLARNDYHRIEVYLNGGPSASPAFSLGDANQDPDQVFTSMAGGMNAEGMAWIDYDNDGDLDLIFENDGYGIDILANDGSGWLSHATPDGDTLGLPAG